MDPLSNDVLDAFSQAKGMTPEQSKGALGTANNGLLNLLKRVPVIGQPLEGFVGSALQTGGEIDKMITGAGSHIPGPIGQFMQGQNQQINKELQAPVLTPDTLAGKAGQVVEKTGEFFAPGGIEKKLLSKVPEVAGLAGKALDIGTKAGVTAGSMGAVTAAQTGGDPNAIKHSLEIGAGAGAFSGLVEAFGPQVSQALAKADFRMTPTKEAQSQKVADAASKFITDNKILGTNQTKFAKLGKITSDMEAAIQTSIPKDLLVPKANVEEAIRMNVESIKETDPAVYTSAKSKADEAISVLNSKDGDTISVGDLLRGKRSWGSMAFKMSAKGKIDPTVSNEGAYAAELGYEKALTDVMSVDQFDSKIKVPPSMQGMFGGAKEATLPDFNKVYSSAINARNLTGMAQFRNDSGLFGRMFGLWVGKTAGQAILPGLLGELGGAAVGEIAAQKLAGGARNASERLLAVPELPISTSKTISGLGSSRGQEDTGQAN